MSTEEKNFPLVAVVSPTYNRRRFVPYLIECYKNQDYKKNRMHWIILDDGQDKVKDLLDEAAKTIPNLHYIGLDEKLTIGAKRNMLNQKALELNCQIIVAMDDDDYYPPMRVSAAVAAFKKNPKFELAGASEIFMYYSDIKTIYKLGPYNANHATNGTMAWKASYAERHLYDETVTHSEERSFLDDYTHPMIQLDPYKVMLVMSHSENTFDKKKLRENLSQFVSKTAMKIKDFIKEKNLREFFACA
jgi:glycosyltransferase involved in cell wall biosynthesis